jgi:putative RNA 2'-phosphotransferase
VNKVEQKNNYVEKNLVYILGVAPDEFGLWLNANGYVKIKDLLGVLRTEEGLRGVTENQIRFLIDQGLGQSPLEIAGDLIRVKPALAPDLPQPSPAPPGGPKLFYIGLKPTAWPVIFNNGLKPKNNQEYAVLYTTKEQAEAVIKRFYPDPVLVTVNRAQAEKTGTKFFRYTEKIHLATEIAKEALFGPPIKPLDRVDPAASPAKNLAYPQGYPMGGYPMAQSKALVHHGKVKGKGEDSPDWKNQTRRDRRKNRP